MAIFFKLPPISRHLLITDKFLRSVYVRYSDVSLYFLKKYRNMTLDYICYLVKFQFLMIYSSKVIFKNAPSHVQVLITNHHNLLTSKSYSTSLDFLCVESSTSLWTLLILASSSCTLPPTV